jgi:hypothetical protein
MSPHQAVALGVRLFAIWLAIYVAREGVSLYALGRNQDDPYSHAIALGAFAVAALLLLVLWFFPRSVARGLLPPASDAPAPPASPDVWFAVGSALIGLWVMTSAVPAIGRDLAFMYLWREKLVDTTDLVNSLLYHVLELFVAAWLILGAAGVGKIIWGVRNAGLR